MIDADTILAMLEQNCKRCRGAVAYPQFARCPDCHDSGKILTPLGHEVIGFVKRHISTPVHR